MNFVQSVKGIIFNGVAAAERLITNHGPSSLGEIKNFLLLQYPSALGTAIHATPLVPALRHAVPGCRIAVAAGGFGLNVFRLNPGIDHVIDTPNPLHNFRGAVATLRSQKLFDGAPYITVTSTGNERTIVALQAVLSGAALRVGFTVTPELYRVPLTYNRSLSQIANNLRIVGALGHGSRHFEPEMFFGDQDLDDARTTLAHSGVQRGQPVVIFITQTSVTQRKGWRVERFRGVARFLTERYGAHILFVGTSTEAVAIDELRGGLDFPTTSVAGKTSLSQLAALMSLCNVGLTLDTGPMHVGRAVGLPMVIVAPAWSPPVEWLPVGNPRFRILKNADMLSAPPDYIIDEVTVEEVTEALADLITSYPVG